MDKVESNEIKKEGKGKFLAQVLDKEKYGDVDKIKVDVSGKIVQQNVLSIEDLRVEGDDGEMQPLPLNVQKLLLQAYRNAKNQVGSSEDPVVGALPVGSL